MHYPWWYVPYLTAPCSSPSSRWSTCWCRITPSAADCFWPSRPRTPIARATSDYLAYLHRHARFFVLLTVVFGAITGVGIWWTIGLASPLATGVLIRTFVFGWATEYVFFILEIVSAFIFYYYWGRLLAADPHDHRLDLRPVGLDQPGADYGDHGLHARSGRLAAGPQFLERRCSIGRPCRRSSRGPAGRCCSARSTSTCTRR